MEHLCGEKTLDDKTKAEIKRRYKEEVHPKGIYSVRCVESDQVWVDSSRNLLSSENRMSFSFKTGMGLNKDLQAALKSCNPEAFRFEVLEIFDEDVSNLALNKLLKDRRIHWQEKLAARSPYR